MLPWKGSKSILRDVVLVLFGMLVVALGQTAGTPIAAARQVQEPAAQSGTASQEPEASVWVSCTPANVVTYSTRVHVKCTAAISGISYFAVSTADASKAARVLSILSTANVAGRTLSILYDPADTSGTSIGCQAADCRLLQAVGF